MNLRTTMILALLATVGIAALWLLGPEGTPPDKSDVNPPQAPVAEKLFQPAPDLNLVTRIAWERAGHPTLVFERTADPLDTTRMLDWRMLEPLASPGENSSINALFSGVATLSVRSAWEPGAKGAPALAETGLEPPQAVLSFSLRDGKQEKVEVGRQPPLSNDTYVRVAGKPTIYLVKRDFGPDLKRAPRDYRAKALLTARAPDVTRLRIEHAGKTAEFTRPLGGTWSIVAPVPAKASAGPIDGLVAKLVGLRAAEFIEDAPATLEPYQFDRPYLKLEVTHERRARPRPPTADPTASAPTTAPAPPETFTLLVGDFSDRKQSQRYVKLADQSAVMSVAQTSLDPLIPDMAKLRDTLIMDVNVADLASVEYTVGGDSVTIANSDGQWRGAGDLAEIDPAALNELLETFAGLRAIDFIDNVADLSEYKLDTPRATLKARQREQGAVVTLMVGKLSESGRNAFVRLEGVPTVFVISSEQSERLVVPPISLRSRGILSFQPEQLERIELSRMGAEYVVVRDGRAWQLSEPADCRIDHGAISALANDLPRLRAKRVVARDPDPSAYGLDAPIATYALTLAPPAADPPTSAPASEPASSPADRIVERLAVGFKNNAGYVRRNDEPFVYEIDESVYRVLVGELIDRRLFGFTADDVTTFVVNVPPSQSLSLRRGDDGKTWVYAPDPFVKLSSKKVDDYLNELGNLRVEAYLAYRDADLEGRGLGDAAPVHVKVGLRTGQEVYLRLAEPPAGELPRAAALVDVRRVFQLKKSDVENMLRGLDYYATPGEPETPPPGLPEGMPVSPPRVGPG